MKHCIRKSPQTGTSALHRCCALWLLAGVAGFAGEEACSQEPATQPKQAPAAEAVAASVQGRQHPSYQVFEHNLTLAEIKLVDKTTLEVGGKIKIDASHLQQMPSKEKEELARVFELPVVVIDSLVARSARKIPLDAETFAKDLRATVVDYKYLLKRWEEYHPPVDGEKPKQNGQKALQTGDIERSWELYRGLRWPAAPTGLRVVEHGKE